MLTELFFYIFLSQSLSPVFLYWGLGYFVSYLFFSLRDWCWGFVLFFVFNSLAVLRGHDLSIRHGGEGEGAGQVRTSPPLSNPESLALSSFLSCPFLVVWCGLDCNFFFSRRRRGCARRGSKMQRAGGAAIVHSESNRLDVGIDSYWREGA